MLARSRIPVGLKRVAYTKEGWLGLVETFTTHPNVFRPDWGLGRGGLEFASAADVPEGFHSGGVIRRWSGNIAFLFVSSC